MSFANDCIDAVGACPNRLWTVQVGQCTEGEALIQLIDPNTGATLDLSAYEIGPGPETSSSLVPASSGSMSSSSAEEIKHGVEIILKEWNIGCQHYADMATVKSYSDAQKGVVYAPYSAAFVPLPGVWLGQASVWEYGVLRKIYPFFWEVSPDLSQPTVGPITVAEVRMAIRDVCPEANFLIDTVECKVEEIMWAIRRPVEYWNEIPPPIGTFTPATFPFRYHWMNAVIGELLIMIGTWLRRNALDYSAGGLQVRDTEKWTFYMDRGQALKAEYREFVKQKKIEINIMGSYASLGGYRSAPYR